MQRVNFNNYSERESSGRTAGPVMFRLYIYDNILRAGKVPGKGEEGHVGPADKVRPAGGGLCGTEGSGTSMILKTYSNDTLAH